MDQHYLTTELAKLTKQMANANSYWKIFLRGIVAGIGTALGATIIAGLLVAFLASVVDSVDDIPILNNIVQSSNLKELLNGDKNK
jgi:hypothetical protein